MAQRGCAAPGCPSDAQFKRLWCGFHLNNPASRLISGRVTYLDVKNKTAFQERARQLITEMAGDVESTIQLVRDLVISDDPDFNSEQEIGKKFIENVKMLNKVPVVKKWVVGNILKDVSNVDLADLFEVTRPTILTWMGSESTLLSSGPVQELSEHQSFGSDLQNLEIPKEIGKTSKLFTRKNNEKNIFLFSFFRIKAWDIGLNDHYGSNQYYEAKSL